MIWITGDKHGEKKSFLQSPNYKKIKKNDTLIVCGDFGFFWNESPNELKNLKWLSKRKFKTIFVNGCNENQQILEKYPLTNWNGGRARLIYENVIQLVDGEFYIIENKKILAYGGGFNKITNTTNSNMEEFNKASVEYQLNNLIKNIKKANREFDIIISHEAPSSIALCLEEDKFHCTYINNILEEIREHASFKSWFFGKYHIDKLIPPRYYAMFNYILPFEKYTK